MNFTFMTRLVFLVVGTLFLIAVAAHGQLLTMGVSGPEAAGPPPPVCSNKLDFTAACNSQYIAVIF